MSTFYRFQFVTWLIMAVSYAAGAGNWVALYCAAICVVLAACGELAERRHRRRMRALDLARQGGEL